MFCNQRLTCAFPAHGEDFSVAVSAIKVIENELSVLITQVSRAAGKLYLISSADERQKTMPAIAIMDCAKVPVEELKQARENFQLLILLPISNVTDWRTLLPSSGAETLIEIRTFRLTVAEINHQPPKKRGR